MNTVITPQELYEKYHAKIERYIYAHINNEHDRADLLQQVFLNVIEAFDSYDPERGSPGTWLYTITRNTVIDYYRKCSREPTAVEFDESLIAAEDSDLPALTEDMLDTLADALECLPERERNIIIYRFYYCLSAKETAERVGVSYANARFLQHTALKKLRRYFEDQQVG